jgi:hypothetical protein
MFLPHRRAELTSRVDRAGLLRTQVDKGVTAYEKLVTSLTELDGLLQSVSDKHTDAGVQARILDMAREGLGWEGSTPETTGLFRLTEKVQTIKAQAAAYVGTAVPSEAPQPGAAPKLLLPRRGPTSFFRVLAMIPSRMGEPMPGLGAQESLSLFDRLRQFLWRSRAELVWLAIGMLSVVIPLATAIGLGFIQTYYKDATWGTTADSLTALLWAFGVSGGVSVAKAYLAGFVSNPSASAAPITA